MTQTVSSDTDNPAVSATARAPNDSCPLRFLTYNVGGLLPKLEDRDFVDYIVSFDFVCLTETFIAFDFESVLFNDFSIFTAKAKKLSFHGRFSGGVMVLIRKTFAPFCERMRVSVDNTVVIKIQRELLHTEKDVMFISSYIPPYDSSFWTSAQHGYGVEMIEQCILDLYGECDDFHVLLCGDLNARTASSNCSKILDDLDSITDEQSDFFPRQSQDTVTNIFGEQLLELCNIFEYVILNGLSENNYDGSFTFISKTGSSTVDYFIVSRELFSSIWIQTLAVENMVESDHMPVALLVNVPHNLFNTDYEQNEVIGREKIVWDGEKEHVFIEKLNGDSIQNRLNTAKANIDNDTEGSLSVLVDCLKLASDCMVKTSKPRKKQNNAYWFDAECRDVRKETRRKLRKFRQSKDTDCRTEYVQAKTQYRQLLRQKKQEYKNSIAKSLASSEKNSAVFWREVRNLGGEGKPAVSGNISMDQWHDHFKSLLSNLDGESEHTTVNDEETTKREESADALNQEISEDEVRKAVNNLKTGKARGVDGVFAEMLKAGGQCVIVFLTKLFNAVFDKGIYPGEWAKAIIIPIYKKGDPDAADNYRGVSLLSIISKCYTSILNKRLYEWLEENNKIVEQQAGFRRNYSTTDQIFNLYAIVQKCLTKKGQKLYVAFVDFRKAFDSVQHNKLLETLQTEGIRGRLFKAIKAMYNSLISCVRANGVFSEFFECPVGVRQGCVLSPTLFSLFINQLANHISGTGRHGVQLLPGLVELFILLFADDVALLATTPFGLQNQLNVLFECCSKLKMEVNKDKTKVMVFRKGGYLSRNEKWYYDGRGLEVVNSYCYLGFTFTTTLSPKQGTDLLVTKGKKAVIWLCKAFNKCKDMSKTVFFKIFDAKIQSILLYASEVWGLHRLDSIERIHLKACKRFLGVPLRSPNKMVYGELGRFPLHINSHVRCIKYWFRLLQMEPDRLPSQAYRMLLNKDELGKKCWASQVREILCKTGFQYVWLQQGVGNVNSFIRVFKQRLIDMFIQEWSETIEERQRYETYRSFKSLFAGEQYINDISVYCFRVAMAQFRLGVLPINNNMSRYNDIPASKNCVFCVDHNENEDHFLFQCPLYSDLRDRFLSKAFTPSVTSVLRWKDSQRCLSVAKYIFHAFKRRQSHLESTTNQN